MVILINAQTLFQQLKQKYFIFACDAKSAHAGTGISLHVAQ